MQYGKESGLGEILIDQLISLATVLNPHFKWCIWELAGDGNKDGQKQKGEDTDGAGLLSVHSSQWQQRAKQRAAATKHSWGGSEHQEGNFITSRAMHHQGRSSREALDSPSSRVALRSPEDTDNQCSWQPVRAHLAKSTCGTCPQTQTTNKASSPIQFCIVLPKVCFWLRE